MSIKDKPSLKKICTTTLFCSLAVLPTIALSGLLGSSDYTKCIHGAKDSESEDIAEVILGDCIARFKNKKVGFNRRFIKCLHAGKDAKTDVAAEFILSDCIDRFNRE